MLRAGLLEGLLLLKEALAWSWDFGPRRFAYDCIASSDRELAELMGAFFEDGLVIVDGVPQADEAHATHELARRLLPEGHDPLDQAFWNLGHIERACLSDFTTGDLPHLAYSSGEIEAHTDGAYLPAPPRAKLMHVVRFDAVGRGGNESTYPESVFVDALQVAAGLSNDELSLLERPLRIRYNDDGESRVFEHMQPVLRRQEPVCLEGMSMGRADSGPKGKYRVAWNRHDRVRPGSEEAAEGSDAEGLAALEAALDAFHRGVGSQQAQLLARLVPGRAYLVDNWRVLHGRKAYAGGKRRLVGADFPQEALLARWQELSVHLPTRGDWPPRAGAEQKDRSSDSP